MPADRPHDPARRADPIGATSAEAEILVSVIVPARNEEAFLPECLRSLGRLEPFGGGLEVIVVDHASSDGTAAIARQGGASLLETRGPTIAAVRNHGARAARGAFLAFLDADCRAAPAWLRSALAHFRVPGVVAVGAQPVAPPTGASWVQEAWAFLIRPPGESAASAAWLPATNVIVRASAFWGVNGFDESLETCEDVDLSYRLRGAGVLVHDPSVRVVNVRLPATLRQLFLKEIWHGRDSYTGIRRGRVMLDEVPSLLAPAVCLAGLVLSIVGLCLAALGGGWWALWAGVGALLAPPLAYSVRALLAKGRGTHLPRFLLVYITYFVARGPASVLWWLRDRLRPCGPALS